MAVWMAVAEGPPRLDLIPGERIPGRIPPGAALRTASVSFERLPTMTSGWTRDNSTDFLLLDDAPDWAARTIGAVAPTGGTNVARLVNRKARLITGIPGVAET
jgi:hypothetical protein